MPSIHPGQPPPFPVEVYQDIFQRATANSECEYDQPVYWQSTYQPFAQCSVITSKSNARQRCQLLLVCQLWHSVGQRIAYETIFIGKHAGALVTGLTRSAKKNNGLGYGRFVRKLVLCSRAKGFTNKTTITRIFAACPNITTIVREAQELSIFPVTLPSLNTLRRLDWWAYFKPPAQSPWENDPMLRYEHSEYEPGPKLTEGANTTSNDLYLLRDIVSSAPNLEYLSIGVDICSQPFKGEHNVVWLPDDSVTASITTLRLATTVPWITQDLNRWSFPNLKHIIVNSKLVAASRICKCDKCKSTNFFPSSLFNDNIQTIEITDPPPTAHWTGVDTVVLENILSRCPNVTELSFGLTNGILPVIAELQTAKLRRLHTLRLQEDELVGYPERNPMSPYPTQYSQGRPMLVPRYRAEWERVSTERFPALRRVYFVGRFKNEAWQRSRGFAFRFFATVSQRLGDRITFLREDGSICDFDQSVYDPATEALEVHPAPAPTMSAAEQFNSTPAVRDFFAYLSMGPSGRTNR